MSSSANGPIVPHYGLYSKRNSWIFVSTENVKIQYFFKKIFTVFSKLETLQKNIFHNCWLGHNPPKQGIEYFLKKNNIVMFSAETTFREIRLKVTHFMFFVVTQVWFPTQPNKTSVCWLNTLRNIMNFTLCTSTRQTRYFKMFIIIKETNLIRKQTRVTDKSDTNDFETLTVFVNELKFTSNKLASGKVRGKSGEGLGQVQDGSREKLGQLWDCSVTGLVHA